MIELSPCKIIAHKKRGDFVLYQVSIEAAHSGVRGAQEEDCLVITLPYSKAQRLI